MAVNPLEPVTPNPAAPAGSTPTEPVNVPVYQKYNGDWSKANEGYFNAVNKLSAVETTAQQLAERNRQLEAYVAQSLGVNGGSPMSDPNDPLAALQSELGLPVEPFRKGIRGEVASELERILGPLLRNVQAEESLASEIENFDQLKGEARKLMASNPEVAENFKAMQAVDNARAWKYAIRETAMQKAAAPSVPPRSAGLPGSATPMGRGPVNPAGVSQTEKEKAAWDYHDQYGDAAPAIHERLSGTSVEQQVSAILQRLGLTPPTGGAQPQGW